MRASVFLRVLLCLSCLWGVQAVLHVATDGVKISQVSIPVASDNAVYQGVVIEITFDSPVFLHTALVNVTAPTPMLALFDEHPPQDGHDGPSSKLMMAGGFATLTCGTSTFETMGGMNQGPPDFAMVSPPTAEPAYSFIRQMSGDIPNQGNDTWLANRVSLLFLINSGGGGNGGPFSVYSSIQEFVACDPHLNFIDGHGSPSGVRTASLVDSANVPFVASIALAAGLVTDSNSVCTFAAFLDFQREFNDIMALFKNVHSQDESKKVQWRLSALLTKRIYRDCNNKFGSFFNYEAATVTLKGVRGCFVASDTPAFAADPCCNQTLSNSMCCAPKASLDFTYQKVASFASDALAQCAHPGVIQFLLEDYITATRNADAFGAALVQPQDNSQTYQDKSAFQQDCQTKVFNQKCVVDTDCVYGDPPMCGQQGICEVDWTRQTEFLIPCYIANMPSDIRAEIMRRQQVPIYSDPAAQAVAFATALADTILSPGCVGPKAQEFQARWDSANQVPIPANLTGCLAEKGCNWDTWTNDTPEKCIGSTILAARGSHLCGLSQGSSYRDFSQQPRCNINGGNDQTTCTALGGSFVAWGPWQSQCLNLTAHTQGDCHGGNFQPGQWYTSLDCANGVCSVPNLQNAESTIDACRNVSICNQPCSTTEQPWAQCTSNEACLAMGSCNDNEFQFCSSTNGQGNVCTQAACVERFTMDSRGQRSQCDSTLDNPWSRIGCIHREITTQHTCEVTHGWSWITKANTRQQCSAHGQGCVPKNNWGNTNGMSSSDCTACGGDYADLYQWIPGRLSPSRFLPLSWVARQWKSVNQVVSTIDFNKMNNLIQDAISAQQAQFALNTMVQMYVRPMQSMKAVICDCMGGDTSTCLSYIPTTFLDTTCTQDPNVENSCAGLTFNAVVADGSTVQPLSVFRTPVGAFVAIASSVTTSGRRRLLTAFEAPTLEIVKNAGDFVVGQLIGDGITFDGVPVVNQTASTICLNSSLTLPLMNPLWTEPDFVYEVSVGVVSAPLNFNVTVTGIQFCTTLTLTNETIKYFPVLRYITWASVNSSLQITAGATSSSSRAWWDPSMPYMPLWAWILSSAGALIVLGFYLRECHVCSKVHMKVQEMKGYSSGV